MLIFKAEMLWKNVKRCFMYINKRPVDIPAALKMFNKHLRSFFGDILLKILDFNFSFIFNYLIKRILLFG